MWLHIPEACTSYCSVHHTADGLRDTIFGFSVRFHRLSLPSLITSISADLTLSSACGNEELAAYAPNSMGARSHPPLIGLALAEGRAKMWPPSHSVMQAVKPFRPMWPMKDDLSRCGWPPQLANSPTKAFIQQRTPEEAVFK